MGKRKQQKKKKKVDEEEANDPNQNRGPLKRCFCCLWGVVMCPFSIKRCCSCIQWVFVVLLGFLGVMIVVWIITLMGTGVWVLFQQFKMKNDHFDLNEFNDVNGL